MDELIERVKEYRSTIIIGGIIGFLMGKLYGGLVGMLLGYAVGRHLKEKLSSMQPQEIFFQATFSVMGKMAKADGRVTEDEIQAARYIMAQMRLTESRKRKAIEYFNAGKAKDFSLEEIVKQLAISLRYRPDIRLIFIEMQIQIAMADGEISFPEQKIIKELCHALGFEGNTVEEIMARAKAQHDFYQQSANGVNQEELLENAYAALGIDKTVTDAEVKKAYRRQMSQHHPDKLVAKGLPEEMVVMAKEKSQEIQAAYELIKAARKA